MVLASTETVDDQRLYRWPLLRLDVGRVLRERVFILIVLILDQPDQDRAGLGRDSGRV